MAARMITSIARNNLRWIQDTYGIESQVAEWAQQLTDRAIPATGGTDFNFGELLEEASNIAQNPDEFAIARVAAERGWGLIRGIRELLAGRNKKNAVRVDNCTFGGLSDRRVLVEVVTVYEIDHDAGTVTFRFFDTFTPAQDDSDTNDRATEW